MHAGMNLSKAVMPVEGCYQYVEDSDEHAEGSDEEVRYKTPQSRPERLKS